MDRAAAEAAEAITLAESLVALQAQRARGEVVVSLDDQWVRIFILDGSPVAVQTASSGEPSSDADTIWESLVGCLQWVEPTIDYHPESSLSPDLTGDPCQVEPLILEAVRRQFDLQELDAAIGPFMAHRPRVLGDVSSIAERCGLYGADEQDFVALASRAEFVEDLLVDGPLDLHAAYQLLYGLVLLGAVSLHDPDDDSDPAGASQGPSDSPDEEPIDALAEEPIDAFDEEPIDAFDEEPIDAFDDASDDAFDVEPETRAAAEEGRLSEEVAGAFEPGLAEFLLDVVQHSDAPPDETVTTEDDDFPPLDQDSLPPPPEDEPASPPDEDDFPPLDQDSLPPPPRDDPAPSAPAPAPAPPAREAPAPPSAPKPSRDDLLRQADEDARRILAEARAAKERQATQAAAVDKPPRDANPPRDPRTARTPVPDPRAPKPRAPEPRAPARDRRAPARDPRTPPPRTPAPSAPGPRIDPRRRPDSRDPRATDPRSAGGRVIVEERVAPTAHDSRVPVRTTQRPVTKSMRHRPSVARRRRALPSDPNQPTSGPAPSRGLTPASPAPRDSSPGPPSQQVAPRTPTPRITPPDTRAVPATGTPPTGRGATPANRGVTPTRGSSNPSPTSTPSRPSDPGRTSDPGGGERQKQLAQLHLKKGKRFLYRNNAPRALPELEKATELDPESVELQLFALWARFTVAPGSPEQAKKTERELKELAGKAMSDDRKFGFSYFVMGQLALREGRNGDAVRSLGTAVKLDPDNQDAKRGHQIAKRRATK